MPQVSTQSWSNCFYRARCIKGRPQKAQRPKRGFTESAIEAMSSEFEQEISKSQQQPLNKCHKFLLSQNIANKNAKQVQDKVYKSAKQVDLVLTTHKHTYCFIYSHIHNHCCSLSSLFCCTLCHCSTILDSHNNIVVERTCALDAATQQ